MIIANDKIKKLISDHLFPLSGGNSPYLYNALIIVAGDELPTRITDGFFVEGIGGAETAHIKIGLRWLEKNVPVAFAEAVSIRLKGGLSV